MNQTQKSIIIEGKKYENLNQIDQQGIQSITYVGVNNKQQFIIQKQKEISNNSIEVINQIRKQQNQKIPKCQHIIKILGTQQEQEQRILYVVMEQGKDNIFNLIQTNTSLCSVQKIKIFKKMIKGVIELHDLGYFHRDLKPENFVYFHNQNNNYTVKLIDFGSVQQNSENEKTQQIGTKNHMAPEVIEGGVYNKTADIWSLGIILYELLTSQDFFQANDLKDLKKLNQEFINNKIDQFFNKEKPENDLIKSMLQKESKNRIKLEILLQKIDQSLKINEQKQLSSSQDQRNLQSPQIQKLSKQINFYQETQQNIQGKEKIQDAIKKHQKITQGIQELEKQERIIFKFDILQQLTHYQQFNSTLEEIQYEQSIQQIDRQFLDEQHKQIDDINNKLIDYLDKFKYLSKNQKYANQINQIINQIGVVFGQLNTLKELISQRTQSAYQQYNQSYNKIQLSLKDFQELYNKLHQKIYDDQQQIEHYDRQKINIKYKWDQFQTKMNQLKDSINNLIKNSYCNDVQTQKLVEKINQINEKIDKFKKKFNQLNLQNSSEEIKIQIKLMDDFQKELKDEQINEIIQVGQIETKQKSYDQELSDQKNQLEIKYQQFLQDQESIKESIEIYKQMIEKKGKLQEQFEQERNILQEYSNTNNENEQLLQNELKNIQKRPASKNYQINGLLEKQQKTNQQIGEKLKNVVNIVSEKEQEIKFSLMDDNLIKNYEDLKKLEKELSIELNTINEKVSNLQLNPQQLKELKEYFLKIQSTIDELMKKINEKQEFKKTYEKLHLLVNYIKQYHLTRYYERIKENANEQKKIQQNNSESDYKKQFQSKQNQEQDENTKKEKEAQDILQRYENVLNGNYNMMKIEVMEKEKEEMEKQIEKIENLIKSKHIVKLRANLKDQSMIKEIINNKQYYKISEFTQGQMLNIIKIILKQQIEQ